MSRKVKLEAAAVQPPKSVMENASHEIFLIIVVFDGHFFTITGGVSE